LLEWLKDGISMDMRFGEPQLASHALTFETDKSMTDPETDAGLV